MVVSELELKGFLNLSIRYREIKWMQKSDNASQLQCELTYHRKKAGKPTLAIFRSAVLICLDTVQNFVREELS